MPLPSPKKGEQRQAFVERCMANATAKREFPDEEQRLGVCHSQWRKKHPGDKPPAEAQAVPQLLTVAGPVELQAADAGQDGQPSPKRFSALAYSGGLLHGMEGFYLPTVIDLEGLTVGQRAYPVLRQHDPQAIVGHTDPGDGITVGNSIRAKGLISGAGEVAREVEAAASAGFPWQISVGAMVQRVISIPEGQTAEANGRKFKGPILMVRKARLQEISFTSVGADSRSSARIAASQTTITPEVFTMTDTDFEKYLEAKGLKLDELSEEQLGELKASYEADTAEPKSKPKGKRKADKPAKDLKATAQLADEGQADPIADYRQQMAAETQRVAGIRTLCAGQHPDLEARAISEGWDLTKIELEVMRERRKAGPAIHDGTPKIDQKVLTAAVRLAGAEPEDRLSKEYGDQTMEQAGRFRGLTFGQLFASACQLEGVPFPGPGASRMDQLKAAFSTASLSGILGDSATKSMLAAYRAVDSVARVVAKKLSVNSFHTYTGYRLTGDFRMREVGADGEITHADADQESFTYQVRTYARMFGITRQALINDDLGVFTSIPQMIGRGAAQALERAFWTLVLANTGTFFGTGNNNYFEGADSTLDSDSLGEAVQMFRQQVDADGEPIDIQPKYLLVPPELEVVARELFRSTNLIIAGQTDVKQGEANIHANKYTPLVSPYLSNSNYTGYSTTAWYVLADPSDSACFGIAYLNGVETPTIEDAPLPSNILGQAWRGYYDFGVCQVDSRAGVKSKGAA